jgi:hypothetical protein
MKENISTKIIPLIIFSSLLCTACANSNQAEYDDYATNKGYIINKPQTTQTTKPNTTAITTAYSDTTTDTNTTTAISGSIADTIDELAPFTTDYTTTIEDLLQQSGDDNIIYEITTTGEGDPSELYEGYVQVNRLIYYDTEGIQQIVTLDDYNVNAEDPAILETINWYYKNVVLESEADE